MNISAFEGVDESEKALLITVAGIKEYFCSKYYMADRTLPDCEGCPFVCLDVECN